jgi:hypothetical protein
MKFMLLRALFSPSALFAGVRERTKLDARQDTRDTSYPFYFLLCSVVAHTIKEQSRNAM